MSARVPEREISPWPWGVRHGGHRLQADGLESGPLGDRWRRRSLTLPNLSTRGAVIHRSAVCGVPLSVRSRVQITGPQPLAGEQVTGVPVPSHGLTPRFSPDHVLVISCTALRRAQHARHRCDQSIDGRSPSPRRNSCLSHSVFAQGTAQTSLYSATRSVTLTLPKSKGEPRTWSSFRPADPLYAPGFRRIGPPKRNRVNRRAATRCAGSRGDLDRPHRLGAALA